MGRAKPTAPGRLTPRSTSRKRRGTNTTRQGVRRTLTCTSTRVQTEQPVQSDGRQGARTGSQEQQREADVAPSWYNPWDLPGSVGGNDYRATTSGQLQHAHCPDRGHDERARTATWLALPGRGQPISSPKEISGAYWDATCNCGQGQRLCRQPRIAIVSTLQPAVYRRRCQQTAEKRPSIAGCQRTWVSFHRGNAAQLT